jgi:hypothetical protein
VRILLSQDTSAYEYDAFISYKNTDTERQRTEDSRLAVQLHEHLQRGGLRVFLSEMTLAEIGSHDFRDAIDDALEKTRVLITVATRVENLTSEWVKYEWQSFHGDMLSGDHPGGAIFSYLTFSPSRENRLPRGLRRFQVIEHGPDGPERLLKFLTTPDPSAADAPVDSEVAEELIGNLPRHASAESWRAELNLALARLNKEDWPGCIQTCVNVARRVVTSALQTLQLAASDDVGANAKRLQASQRFPRQFFDALRDVERSKQQVHPTFTDAEAALESTTRDIAGYYIREILAPDPSPAMAKTHDPRLTQRTLIEAFRDALFESDPKKAKLVLERLQKLPTGVPPVQWSVNRLRRRVPSGRRVRSSWVTGS